MLAILGDIHGDFRLFERYIPLLDETLAGGKSVSVIQVGDFGYYPLGNGGKTTLENWPKTNFPVYFVEGNHSWHPYLRGLDSPTKLKKNLWYMPRGTIQEIEGYRIGFCGGANSVDMKYQKRNGSWFPEEVVTQADVDKFNGKTVDILITHAPPMNIVYRTMGKLDTGYWGLPYGWVDESAMMIEQLWGNLGTPPIYSGHLHISYNGSNATILDIGEMQFIKSKHELENEDV